MGNTINGQAQNAQANALAESQQNQQQLEDAKKLNDLNTLISKLNQ